MRRRAACRSSSRSPPTDTASGTKQSSAWSSHDRSSMNRSGALDVGLRPVTDTDEELLLGLFADTRATEISMLPTDMASTFAASQYALQQLQYRTTYPDADRLIITRATRDEVTDIGQIIVDRPARGTWTVVDITIARAARSQGVATAVLQQICDDADAADAAIELSVFDDNPARHLYEQLGFIVRSHHTGYVPMRRAPREGVST